MTRFFPSQPPLFVHLFIHSFWISFPLSSPGAVAFPPELSSDVLESLFSLISEQCRQGATLHADLPTPLSEEELTLLQKTLHACGVALLLLPLCQIPGSHDCLTSVVSFFVVAVDRLSCPSFHVLMIHDFFPCRWSDCGNTFPTSSFRFIPSNIVQEGMLRLPLPLPLPPPHPPEGRLRTLPGGPQGIHFRSWPGRCAFCWSASHTTVGVSPRSLALILS